MKSGEALINELQKLRQEYNELKTAYDSEVTGHQQQNHLQSLSYEILVALNSNHDLEEMIAGVLRSIQQETNFSAVGIRLKNGNDFPYFTQNGFSEEFLLTENSLTVKGRDGGICRDQDGHPILECTCGMVISGKTDPANPFLTTGGSFWTNNSFPLLDLLQEQDPRVNPRNKCIHTGYGSFALIPIRANETIVGILQLNEKKKEAFTLGMINFFEEIGEMIGAALMRKQAEESASMMALRNQTLLLAASDGIHVLDERGNVVEANLSFCKMLGYSREELLRLNVAAWDIKWTGEKLLTNLVNLMDNPAVFETRHRRKDGSVIDVEINGVGVTLEGRKLLYASARDITDRKQTAKALKESGERYKNLSNQLEAILDHIPSLVFYKDTRNTFIRVNKYVAEAYRKTKEELEGTNLSELYPEDVAEQYYQDDLSVIHSGMAKLNIEERWDTTEGLKWVKTSKIPFADANGTIIGVIGISEDITDRKRAEAEIKMKNAELVKLVAEKDKFFSIIAHDLRSPFNGFLGLTQIIVEDLPEMKLSEIQKIALSLRSSASNLYQLLENLLDWSQFQRGLTSFNPLLLLLKPKIADSIQLVSDQAQKKDIAIVVDIPDDLKVFADRNMLGSAIRNLISNAVKFTLKGGKINITAKRGPGNSVEIAVQDTGIGMDRHMIENLFHVGENISRRGTAGEPSTGLGLILCKDFIEKHGGKIWAESEEGIGSTFFITLQNIAEPIISQPPVS